MRNLKKLLAVIVAICVLASFTVPAFAAESFTNDVKAQKLYDLKLFSGTSTSQFVPNLGGALTREQGMMLLIRLFGKEADALAMTDADTVLAKFSDYKTVSAYAKKHVAYAVKTGLVAGTSATTVGAGAEFTGDMISAIILRELGFTGIDFAKSTATLAEKKIITAEEAAKLATKALIRDDAVGIMFASLQAADTKGVTIIAKLVAAKVVDEAKAIAAGVITPAPAKLEVASATADNLKVAKIVFNKEVDSATVKTANIKATGILDAKLGADKKTVYAIMPMQKQSTTLDFTIENVKDTLGNVIDKTVKAVSFVDTAVPVINGVVAKNAKTLEISASEPLDIVESAAFQVFSGIKVDGVQIIAKATQDLTKNTVTLTLNSLIAAGTHKVEVSNLTDFATYKAVTATFNIEVVADTAAPVMTEAKVNNIREIEVTFNEILDESYVGTYSVNGTTATPTLVTSDKSKVKLALGKDLDIGATVEIKIAYKGQADVVGNKVSTETNFVFKISDDTAIPTVTAALSSKNVLTLTFSKTMQTVGTIKVFKGTSTTPAATPSVAFKADTNNTVIEIPAADASLSAIDPVDVKVNITGMKDATIRANALGEQNITLKANDTKAPTVAATYLITPGSTTADDTVTFYFSEAMDTATLNNLSNYVLDCNDNTKDGALSAYPSAAVSSVAADAMSVKIKVPGISAFTTANFTVYALKDVAGNMLTTATVGMLGDKSLSVVGNAKATAANKIEVYFNSKISSFDPSVFKLTKGGKDEAVFVNYSIDATTGTKVALTLASDIATNFNGYELAYSSYTFAKNIYGTELTSNASISITDGVAPKATVATGTTTAGSIQITFGENIQGLNSTDLNNAMILRKDGTSVTTHTINYFNDNTAVAAGAIFNKVVITGLDTSKEYTVQLIDKNILDIAGNTVAALAETKVSAK